jgi:hypothetical protein
MSENQIAPDPDAGELGQRLRRLRDRFDEFRGRL